jgi:hypothetical protein
MGSMANGAMKLFGARIWAESVSGAVIGAVIERRRASATQGTEQWRERTAEARRGEM